MSAEQSVKEKQRQIKRVPRPGECGLVQEKGINNYDMWRIRTKKTGQTWSELESERIVTYI